MEEAYWWDDHERVWVSVKDMRSVYRLRFDGQLAYQEVWRRDARKCQCCSGPARIMHHIVRFKDSEALRNDVSNLVLLCDKCHRWVHSSRNVDFWFLGSAIPVRLLRAPSKKPAVKPPGGARRSALPDLAGPPRTHRIKQATEIFDKDYKPYIDLGDLIEADSPRAASDLTKIGVSASGAIFSPPTASGP